MKKIAVVGAGFSGLAISYHLLKRGGDVTLFDSKGIGGGASGIASGLLHPYPGERGRISWRGDEGLRETKHFLDLIGKKVYREGGILKLAVTSHQESALRELAKKNADVEWWSEEKMRHFSKGHLTFPGILIQSGVTVHSSLYLRELWKMCEALGGQFEKKKVFLEDLEGFDCVVLAVGGGIREFAIVKNLNLRFNKGQLLVCQKPSDFNAEKSFIGKGYFALSEAKDSCVLGTTYERDFKTEDPCKERAIHLIFDRLSQFFPLCRSFQIEKCLSEMRVVNSAGPRPMVEKFSQKLYAITGMGSRGLLYHALVGKELAREILP